MEEWEKEVEGERVVLTCSNRQKIDLEKNTETKQNGLLIFNLCEIVLICMIVHCCCTLIQSITEVACVRKPAFCITIILMCTMHTNDILYLFIAHSMRGIHSVLIKVYNASTASLLFTSVRVFRNLIVSESDIYSMIGILHQFWYFYKKNILATQSAFQRKAVLWASNQFQKLQKYKKRYSVLHGCSMMNLIVQNSIS